MRSVWVDGNRVVISKAFDAEWARLAKKVGQTLRDLLMSGLPLVMGEPVGEANQDINDDERIRAMVESILVQQINPGLAGHGGFVQVTDIKEGVASVCRGGGCQGCGLANETLRGTVEVALKKAVPGLKAVVDATDHASGENPYY